MINEMGYNVGGDGVTEWLMRQTSDLRIAGCVGLNHVRV
jgi:hypothetical protein